MVYVVFITENTISTKQLILTASVKHEHLICSTIA